MKLFNRQRGSLGNPNNDLNFYGLGQNGKLRSSEGSKQSLVGSGTTDYTNTHLSTKIAQVIHMNNRGRDTSIGR